MGQLKSYAVIVPARAGSKGITRKNLVELSGKSLIAWAIQVAKKANIFADIVFSSENQEFLNEGLNAGATVTLRRPQHLATDTTKQIDVLKHACAQLSEDGKLFDHWVLLQPTSPFRRPRDLINAVNLHRENPDATLISICNTSKMHPSTIYQGSVENLQPLEPSETNLSGTLRQSFNNRFWRNGSIYILNRTEIERGVLYAPHILGYEMAAHESINIDEPKDLVEAKNFLSSNEGMALCQELWEEE
jgi:N-acylneuraminate cytidylyltransferase/CMP-N,N'-diacetyllegionaminic acid synthase